MKKLSQSFNQSLLEPTKPSTSTSPSTNSNQETDEDEDPQLNNRNSNIKEDYYQSEAWEKKITDTLESFSVPNLISHTRNYKHRTTRKHRLNNNPSPLPLTQQTL